MEAQEISFTFKLTSDFISAVAHKMVEIQEPTLKNEVPQIYTIKEVSRLVGKTPATVTKHCRLGLLKAEKSGKSYLITENNLKNYIDAK